MINLKTTNIYIILAVLGFGIYLSMYSVVNAITPSVISSDSVVPYNTGSTHSVVLNKPGSLQNGDMLITIIHNKRVDPDPSGVFDLPTTPPSGWTALSPYPFSLGPAMQGTAYFAYKVITNAGSEPATYSFDISTTPASFIVGDAAIVQVRNGVAAFPASSFEYVSADGGFPDIEAPSVYSQGDSLWLISGLGNYLPGHLNPSGSPSGFTNLEYQTDSSTSYFAFSVDYKTVSNGETGTAVYPKIGSAAPLASSSLVICGGGIPTALSYYPGASQVYVPRISSLTLILSEDVVKGTGNIYIKRYSDDTTLLTIPVASSNVTIEGDVVKIRLLSCVAAGEQVYVIIDSGAFLGPCNGPYAGISNKDTWKFYISRICNMFYNEI